MQLRRTLVGALIGAHLLAAGAAVAKPKVAALAQARVEAAHKAYDAVVLRWRAGRGDADDVGRWSLRWLEAERDQPHTRKTIAAALDGHLARMRALADDVKQGFATGQVGADQVQVAAYWLADAEWRVERGE